MRIPAIYFHSLCGTENFLDGVKETGQNRTINRRKWNRSELEKLLKMKIQVPEKFSTGTPVH